MCSIFIKLGIHDNYDGRMNPIEFGGQRSRSLTNVGCTGMLRFALSGSF